MPDIRLVFRHETLLEELKIIHTGQDVSQSLLEAAPVNPTSDHIGAKAMGLAEKLH